MCHLISWFLLDWLATPLCFGWCGSLAQKPSRSHGRGSALLLSREILLVAHRRMFKWNKPDNREPLHDNVLAQMMRLADEGHPLSSRKAIWLWTKLGRYTCFRCQKIAMESRSVIQVYVKPNGTHVVGAFRVEDFI